MVGFFVWAIGMQAPAPAKVNQLYNDLTSLPYDAVEQIRKIGWQLRLLNRQKPGDIATRVALLQALAMDGLAEEAREVAISTWPYRNAMPLMVRWSYCVCLSNLGLYELATQLLPSFEGHLPIGSTGPTLKHIASGLGDGVFFSRLAEFVDPKLRPICCLLASHPDYLRARQDAVRKVVAGRQVAYTSFLAPDDGETDGELNISIYAAGDFRERRLLEQQIDDAVARTAAEFGVAADLLPIVENVHDYRAHPAPKRAIYEPI